MRIGSLFSGIGGLELGLEWAGVGRAVWQVERDEWCRNILAKHWPDAERFDDVRTVGAHNLSDVEVICGGFPCQDISYAGRGAGLAGERSGLWFEYARIVRELRPRFVVVENVSALLARGLDAVLGTLASLGYDAEWSCIRASDVGARHRRERVFVVAWRVDDAGGVGGLGGDRHLRGAGSNRGLKTWEPSTVCASREGGANVADGDVDGLQSIGLRRLFNEKRTTRGDDAHRRGERHVGDADRARRQGAERQGSVQEALDVDRAESGRREGAERAEPRVGRTADGLSARLDVAGPDEPQHEWEAPRVVATCEDRARRLRALGNAVVPQVAELVGRRLMEIARSCTRSEAA